MPFTPAHTAIVLPFLRRRYVSATGLIVGSVAPDFEYFFKMSVDGIHGHTLPGLFYFDVPVVVLLSLIFHKMVKRNLILNSPDWIQRRFYLLLEFDFSIYLRRHWLVFLFSALAGSASHILWDSFTHGNGYFARTLWFYKGTKVPFLGVDYPLFYALQYISTFVGMLVLVIYITRMRPNNNVQPTAPNVSYWIIWVVITVIAFSLRFLLFPDDLNIGNAVVSLISSLCLASVVGGGVFQRTSVRGR